MTDGKAFLEELGQTILMGDGAMGTELVGRGADPTAIVEMQNLDRPDLVRDIHREYVSAGSRVIETNTFAANRPALARQGVEGRLKDILTAGVRLAREAAEEDVYVAASMGPLPKTDGENLSMHARAGLFREQAAMLLEAGPDIIIFETFTRLEELVAAVSAVRGLTDAPIIAQMAFESGGRTPYGDPAAEVARRAVEAGADVVGANCGDGIPAVLKALSEMAACGRPRSAFVNGGLPEEIRGRRTYMASPQYLARRASELAEMGASLIGGCCGTGPDFVRAVARMLGRGRKRCVRAVRAVRAVPAVPKPDASPTPPAVPAVPRLPQAVLVELDPPKELDVEPLLRSAGRLEEAGVGAVTLADNPLASARMDNMTVAGLIMRRTGLAVIPHLTGRDRNRIALQSSIMGAHAIGVRAMLCVTGDPVRMYHEADTSGVFDLNSIGLVRLVSEFNAGQRAAANERTSFSIGVAVNPNAANLPGQMERLSRKVEAGAHFVLTQPVFEEGRAAALLEAMTAAKLTIPVHLGVMPLTSARNAEFLHNEVPGISIPENIRNRLSGYSALADQRKAALDFAGGLVEKLKIYSSRFYLIAPRNSTEMILPLFTAAGGRAAAKD